jgi:AraC family transcriptional regulator
VQKELAVYHSDVGSLIVCKAHRSVIPHAHSDHQISINLGPENVIYTVGGRDCVTRVGEMVLINPWTTHARRVESCCPALVISLAISPAWVVLARRGSAIAGPVFTTDHVRLGAPMWESVLALSAQLLRPSEADEAILQRHLGHFVDAVLREHSRSLPVSDTYLRFDMVDRRVRRALELMGRDAIGRINVDDVASRVGMSRAHFYRQFRKDFGVSPLHAINSFRIAWARSRIGAGELRIADISDQLGFSTPGHFTRFFEMHIGVSPSEYRSRFHQLAVDS